MGFSGLGFDLDLADWFLTLAYVAASNLPPIHGLLYCMNFHRIWILDTVQMHLSYDLGLTGCIKPPTVHECSLDLGTIQTHLCCSEQLTISFL